MNVADLPGDVLRVVANHPTLSLPDRANLARACSAFRDAVVFRHVALRDPAAHLPFALNRGLCERLDVGGEPRALIAAATARPDLCRRIVEVGVVTTGDAAVLLDWLDDLREHRDDLREHRDDRRERLDDPFPALARVSVVFAMNPCARVACRARPPSVRFGALDVDFDAAWPCGGLERLDCLMGGVGRLSLLGRPSASQVRSLARFAGATALADPVRHLTLHVTPPPDDALVEALVDALLTLATRCDRVDVDSITPHGERLTSAFLGAVCRRANEGGRVPALHLCRGHQLEALAAHLLPLAAGAAPLDRLHVTADLGGHHAASSFAAVATSRVRCLEVTATGTPFPVARVRRPHVHRSPLEEVDLAGYGACVLALLTWLTPSMGAVRAVRLRLFASTLDIGLIECFVGQLARLPSLRRVELRCGGYDLSRANAPLHADAASVSMRWFVSALLSEAGPGLETVTTEPSVQRSGSASLRVPINPLRRAALADALLHGVVAD